MKIPRSDKYGESNLPNDSSLLFLIDPTIIGKTLIRSYCSFLLPSSSFISLITFAIKGYCISPLCSTSSTLCSMISKLFVDNNCSLRLVSTLRFPSGVSIIDAPDTAAAV